MSLIPTLIGSNSGTSTPLTITTSGAIPAGSLIFVAVQSSASPFDGVSSITVSDGTRTNTLTKSDAVSGTFDDLEIWACPNSLANNSSATVTITFSAGLGGAASAVIGYAPNIAPTSPVDQTAGSVNSSGGTSVSATTGTLSGAVELAIGATFVIGSGAVYATAPAGFTSFKAPFTNSAGVAFSVDYEVTSTTAAVTYGPVWNKSGRVGSIIVTFKGYFLLTIDSVAAPEFESSLLADDGAEVEWYATSPSDMAVGSEITADVTRVSTLPVELIVGKVADMTVQLETISGKRIDATAAIEIVDSFVRDTDSPLEGATSVRSDARINVEWVGDQIVNSGVLIEISSAVDTDSSGPIEIVVSTISDSTPQVEIISLNVSAASSVEAEFVSLLVGDSPIEAEIASSVVIQTGDSGIPLEWGLSVVADQPAQSEFIAVFSRDEAAEIEFGSSFTADAAALVEILPAIGSNGRGQVEIVGSQLIDAGSNLEWVERFLADVVVQVEDSSKIAEDAVAPAEMLIDVVASWTELEIVGSQIIDTATQTEVVVTLARDDAVTQAEVLSDQKADYRTPQEILSTVLPTAAVTPLDITSSVTQDVPAVVEIGSDQSASAAIQTEWDSSVEAQFSGSALPIEATSGVTKDIGATFEDTGGVAQGAGAETENIADQSASSPVAVEWLGTFSVTLDGVALLEFLSGVRRDIPGALEVVSAQRADILTAAEVISGKNTDASGKIEILANQTSDTEIVLELLLDGEIKSAVQLEFTDSLATFDGVAPIEFVAGLSKDSAVPAETLTSMVTDRGSLLEVISSFVTDTIAQLEIESTLSSSAGDGAIQFEITVATKGDSGVQVEIKGFGRGRGNQNQLHSVLVSGFRTLTRS